MSASADVKYLDPLTHSPDGESRGLLARVGDLFPLDPREHLRSGGIHQSATAFRPWGMRFLTVPPIEAGEHEGTGEFTSEIGDGQGPEEMGKD